MIICPGSRNAPLIMAFVRLGKIRCTSVVDERSAAFVALGMAKQLKTPVAIICTSGTAVLNLYPAIAEAFYMQVPLLVITADRPEEMLDRWDGQTIHQFTVFEPHVLGSFQTPEAIEEDQIEEITVISESLYDTTNGHVKGPAHLNVPLKEPLYAAALEVFEYPEVVLKDAEPIESDDWEIAIDKDHFFVNYPKVMILNGADEAGENIEEFKQLKESSFALVLSDVISNKHAYQNIRNWEGIFLNADEALRKELVPDLLVTTGKMILNKTIKTLFRKHPPKRHWHIAENGFCADTFFTAPEILALNPTIFFKQFNQFLPSTSSSYFNRFKLLAHKQKALSERTIDQYYNEFSAVKTVFEALPENIVLHLANSMPIRYVAYLNEYLKDSWQIHANRGVSGIDGCTSTAVGAAMTDDGMHILLTGDIAFLYDINALWQEHLPTNLKIILLNNSGGGIFKNIDGPALLPELNPFIATPHQMNARLLAEHFKLVYFSVSNQAELKALIPEWLQTSKACILEIQTDPNINSEIFKQYKQQII